MKKLAYFKIEENMTPRSVAEEFAHAAACGFGEIIVEHEEGAQLSKTAYKEKLLAVLRAAFRSKVKLYLADDSFAFSGTGFSLVSSVRDTWQRGLVVKNKSDVTENDEILSEKDGRCVVAVYGEGNDKYPYSHYPDLTDGSVARMVIESVYEPVLREYSKFVNFELAGFLCRMPIVNSLGEECVPYSKAAVEKCGADKLFDIAQKGDGYEKYMQELCRCMEKNFVFPLKRFCDEHKLGFKVYGGLGSVTYDFCKKQGIEYMTDSLFDKGGIMRVANGKEALEACLNNLGLAVEIAPGMDSLARMGEFFEKEKGICVLPAEDFGKGMGECAVLTNMTDKVKQLGFLPEGEWVIYDWEKGEVYDFEKKTYTFYPHSFLCIKKKAKEMYPEILPVRVGGVVTGDYEVEKSLKAEKYEDVVKFRLPEDSLSGKCVEFVGECEFMKVKMGYNEYSFTGECRVVGLFDFLCGKECDAYVYNGKIDGIRILKKAQLQ